MSPVVSCWLRRGRQALTAPFPDEYIQRWRMVDVGREMCRSLREEEAWVVALHIRPCCACPYFERAKVLPANTGKPTRCHPVCA